MPTMGIDHLGVTHSVNPQDYERARLVRTFGNPALPTHWIYEAKGFYSYTQSWVNTTGARLMWNESRADMGVHAILNGRAMHALDAVEAVYHALRFPWSRITRIDINVDFSNVTGDACYPVSHYIAQIESGAQIGRKRNLVPVGTEKMGLTAYYGGRTSDAFMRIYDKAKEAGLDDSVRWVRFELVLKGGKARALTDKLRKILYPQTERQRQTGVTERQRLDVQNLLLGVFKSFIWFNDADFARVPACDMVVLEPGKNEKKTLQWLNSLAPTIAKQAALDPVWYAGFLEDIEAQIKSVDELHLQHE